MLQRILSSIAALAIIGTSVFVNSASAANPSTYGGSPSQITFSNNSSSTYIALYWSDYYGNERYQESLAPNSAKTINTSIGHVWVARDTSNGTVLTTVTSSYSTQQVSITPPNYNKSPYSSVPARLYVANLSNMSITLNWLNRSGYEEYTRTIAPGGSFTQDTYMDQIWIVRDAQTGREVGRVTVTNTYQTYTYGYGYNSYSNSSNPYSYSNNSIDNASVVYSREPIGKGNWQVYSDPNWDRYNTRAYNVQPYYYSQDIGYSDAYSVRQACHLNNGTYSKSIDIYQDGEPLDLDISTFTKKGSKITFTAYEDLDNGRRLASRWVLNCKTGVATEQ